MCSSGDREYRGRCFRHSFSTVGSNNMQSYNLTFFCEFRSNLVLEATRSPVIGLATMFQVDMSKSWSTHTMDLFERLGDVALSAIAEHMYHSRSDRSF